MERIYKYPRTRHVEGSRKQAGDEDLNSVRFAEIKGKYLVLEEKIDGANCGISFGEEGRLYLQSRGHFLNGGYGESQFDMLKVWAECYRDRLRQVLGSRYVMYGEWMFAKHTVFYDRLPHYFMEFDIFDREREVFLDTPSRRKLTAQMPICSVPVLAQGVFESTEQILSYLGESNYIRAGHIERLREYCLNNGQDAQQRCAETDQSTTMEGLYIKIEENGCTVGRLKYVRVSFAQTIAQSGTHWIDRPIIPNGLAVPMESLFLPL